MWAAGAGGRAACPRDAALRRAAFAGNLAALPAHLVPGGRSVRVFISANPEGNGRAPPRLPLPPGAGFGRGAAGGGLQLPGRAGRCSGLRRIARSRSPRLKASAAVMYALPGRARELNCAVLVQCRRTRTLRIRMS